MVKNTTGGNKHKGQARKLVCNSKQATRLRIAEEQGELYAQVTKMLGNGMCNVLSIDNQPRLCFIRGKFRGRGKRDNTLKIGTWLLIGKREWEPEKISTDKDLQKCDLLEVYTDLDKERLKKTVNCNWSIFIENDATFTNTKADDQINFEYDGNTDEYKQLVEMELKNNNSQPPRVVTLKISEEDGNNNEINIDDI
jgi:translation initiation factor 1A